MPSNSLQKVVIIIGPTASGKTRLAVQLAKDIKGEIISADSRQVFRGMDIGTGKDLVEYGDIPYHLIDIREPGDSFSVSDFQQAVFTSLADITSRNKVPIICGGTMYYVKALLDDYTFDHPETDKPFTENLESEDRETLYRKLKELNIWETHHWENDSRRRMARAIEKVHAERDRAQVNLPHFNFLYSHRMVYIETDRSRLKRQIRDRLDSRVEEGLLAEVTELMNRGVSQDQMERYGLEYRWISRYACGKIQLGEALDHLATDISRFAKRQMTFIRYLEKTGHHAHPIKSYGELREYLADWFTFPR